MIVYRVEHPEDGKGIWHSKYEAAIRDVIARHGGFPPPRKDGIGYIDTDEFCAYLNKEVMLNFLSTEDFVVLKKHGFRVYELNLVTCRAGRYQVVYQKKDIIESKDITEFLTS